MEVLKDSIESASPGIMKDDGVENLIFDLSPNSHVKICSRKKMQPTTFSKSYFH